MHIRLPQRIEESLSFWRRKLLPRTLFFRTMLLIFIPLIVVQIVSVVVFFDGSWSRMGRRLSDNLVDEIKMIINLNEHNFSSEALKNLAMDNFQIDFETYSADQHNEWQKKVKFNPIVVAYLRESLESAFQNEHWKILFNRNSKKIKGDLVILIKKGDLIYQFSCSLKRIFSTSIFMFVVWMVATSVLLFLVSVLFLRIQVRAIADLARTSENFGKGIYDDGFKPYGSSEVRKAGFAFLTMKERIFKQIKERTQMLAGISHDLRTPLTRMKLLVTMMPNSEDKQGVLTDIDEMEKMLNGYLAFVRGEGDEVAAPTDVCALIKGIVDRFSTKKTKIKLRLPEEPVEVVAKEQALRRAITNIVANADRYGKKIVITLETAARRVRIIVDDNGPGIPKNKREDVFRAFYRLESSRNKETGGIGLGLAITKDIITAHGGTITLEDGPMGGLRVIIEVLR